MYKVVLFLVLVILSSCRNNVEIKEKTPKQVATAKYEIIEELPKAIHYDINLELDMIKAANSFQKRFTVSEVIITSSRWSSTFNESGSLIARSRNATIVVNEGDLCLLQDVVFEQKKDGGKFMESAIIENKAWYSFKCNLLKIKNPDVLAGAQFQN